MKELEETIGVVRKMKASLQSLSSSLTGEQIDAVVGRVLKLKQLTSWLLHKRTESSNKFHQINADVGTYLIAHQLPQYKTREAPPPQLPPALAETTAQQWESYAFDLRGAHLEQLKAILDEEGSDFRD